MKTFLTDLEGEEQEIPGNNRNDYSGWSVIQKEMYPAVKIEQLLGCPAKFHLAFELLALVNIHPIN